MHEMQLYMWSGTRSRYLERHIFYVEEVRTRLLNQFADIESEADKHEQEAYDCMVASPGFGETDLADIAEIATDAAVAHYQLLFDLRKQVLLGAVAGMYHQWDKDIREFIEAELRHYADPKDLEKQIWKATGNDIFGILEAFGWPIKSTKFFPNLEASSLIVNVYKHGKGPSLKTLSEKFPSFLPNPLGAVHPESLAAEILDYDWLAVGNADFDDFALAFEEFWKEMPERLYYTPPS